MAATGTPDIRGEQRSELVADLAAGTLTHTQLGAKFNRHPQAIAQFAVRNRGEIAAVQAGNHKALHERLADIDISDKARRIAVDQLLRDDLLAKLDDPDLPLADRNRLTKTCMALQRHVAEEMGDLRSHIDVTATKSLLTDFDIIDYDAESGTLSAVKPAPDSGD
jgi:hypothetical protein